MLFLRFLVIFCVIAHAIVVNGEEFSARSTNSSDVSNEFRGMNAGITPNRVDAISIEATGAQYGLDVSTTISSSSASCFVGGGYSFAVPRGYRSSGSVDTQVFIISCTSSFFIH